MRQVVVWRGECGLKLFRVRPVHCRDSVTCQGIAPQNFVPEMLINSDVDVGVRIQGHSHRSRVVSRDLVQPVQ